MIAWIGAESKESALLCLAAIALHALRASLSPQVARLLTLCCATIAALTAAGEMGAHVYTTVAAWKDSQGGLFDLVAASTTTIMLRTPVTALALAWALSDYRVPRPALLGAAAVLAVLALGDMERRFGVQSGARDERASAGTGAHGRVASGRGVVGRREPGALGLAGAAQLGVLSAWRRQCVFASAHDDLAGSHSRAAGCRLDRAERVHALDVERLPGKTAAGLHARENRQDLRAAGRAGVDSRRRRVRRTRCRRTSPRNSGALPPKMSRRPWTATRSRARFAMSR